jgi:hypothetical protein
LPRTILADLQKLPADLVKLAADFVDQAEPLRGEQNRPFRALAIQLEQPYRALAVIGHAVDNLVERDLGNGFAAPPDDRAVSRVEDAFQARIRLGEQMIAVKA